MTDERLRNSRFMRAVRREPVDTTPVWIMRQAGRYLPEYMEVRNRVTFMDLCKKPELSAEVTLSAQRVLGVDAAILFADLLPMLEPMGMRLEYQAGEGPVFHNPIESPQDVDRLKELTDLDSMHFTYDAIRLIRRELPGDIPLLGFAGAPFTLASYIIEGKGSRNYIKTKRLMYGDEGAWKRLMSCLVNSLIRYLKAQIAAGCQCVQIFDSWAGCLSVRDYQRYAFPYVKQVIDAVSEDGPVINFLTGNPALLDLQIAAGGAVLGVDWRCDLKEVRRRLAGTKGVQGNLDPVTLFAGDAVVREQTLQTLADAGSEPGYIFNLGHGVLPETPAQQVKDLVKLVHETGLKQSAGR